MYTLIGTNDLNSRKRERGKLNVGFVKLKDSIEKSKVVHPKGHHFLLL